MRSKCKLQKEVIIVKQMTIASVSADTKRNGRRLLWITVENSFCVLGVLTDKPVFRKDWICSSSFHCQQSEKICKNTIPRKKPLILWNSWNNGRIFESGIRASPEGGSQPSWSPVATFYKDVNICCLFTHWWNEDLRWMHVIKAI